MDDPTSMKHTALEIQLNPLRIRIGSSVFWAAVVIVLAWTGHTILTLPAAALRLLNR